MATHSFLLHSLKTIGFPGLQHWKPERDDPSLRFPTTEEFLREHANGLISKPDSHSLDLGCGTSPRNPFGAEVSRGVDIRPSEDLSIVGCDLCVSEIPFADESFEYVTAFDFIEHIPRVTVVDGRTTFPFVNLMSEIHRILKPDGLFYSHTPAYPCSEAFQDPTHVNIITEKTFPLYFCSDRWASAYGFKGSFNLVAQEWCRPSLLTLMKKTTF
ncbi:MAG: class I SAM-dependent methyltransferase [Cyanobacteriota bacterium]|nr:class I SAM-dependent methyltransferase [Cyanobacteriota bacterium]